MHCIKTNNNNNKKIEQSFTKGFHCKLNQATPFFFEVVQLFFVVAFSTHRLYLVWKLVLDAGILHIVVIVPIYSL